MFAVYFTNESSIEPVKTFDDIYEAAEWIAEEVKQAVIDTWNVPEVDIRQEF